VIGDGAFGVVTKCKDKETGELVAIKKMKQRYLAFEECLQLKEVVSLRKIKHDNIVKLLQLFRENDYFYMVFELLESSLLNSLNQRSVPFSESEIRYVIHQILNGLNAVHKQGFFHRDMKPDNLLWSNKGILKIADFGLAREIRSRPPFTEYISTRWYRAPEIILRHPFYNSPVDIWAVGAIMAELFMLKPLFQGTSEADQLIKICGVLGTSALQDWQDSQKLISKLGIRLSFTPAVSLATLMPNASSEAIELMYSFLNFDPSKRPSAALALNHPFFEGEMRCPFTNDESIPSPSVNILPVPRPSIPPCPLPPDPFKFINDSPIRQNLVGAPDSFEKRRLIQAKIATDTNFIRHGTTPTRTNPQRLINNGFLARPIPHNGFNNSKNMYYGGTKSAKPECFLDDDDLFN